MGVTVKYIKLLTPVAKKDKRQLKDKSTNKLSFFHLMQ
jgi:hypothetical protein